MLFAELFVKAPGDTLADVAAGAGGNIQESERFLVVERDEERVELLQDDLAGLARRPVDLPDAERLAGIAAHPLPDLAGFTGIGEDDEVFVGGLGHLALDLAAGGGVRKLAGG